jgi:hypothetical protein
MADGTQHPPRRVVVSSPRRRGTRTARRPVAAEIDEQTRVGEVYVRSLVRAQLRLALVVTGSALGALFLLPLLFRLDAVADARAFGVPLPWFVLGFLVYPAILAVAGFYVRQAERLERQFADMVAPSETADPYARPLDPP